MRSKESMKNVQGKDNYPPTMTRKKEAAWGMQPKPESS